MARYLALGVGAALLTLGGAFVLGDSTDPRATILHGAPGMRHTPNGAKVRWRTPETTLYIDSSVERLGPKAPEAIRNAFGTWLETNARLPRLTFGTAHGTQAGMKPDGKNTVVLAPITVKGHERDLAITLTYSDDETGNVVEADIVINSNYPFDLLESTTKSERGDDDNEPRSALEAKANGAGERTRGEPGTDDPESPDDDAIANVSSTIRAEQNSSCVAHVQPPCGRDVYDLENVLAHEAGHFFALGEDMTDTSATMYACTNRCEIHKRVLTDADEAALAVLYAEEPGEAGDPVAGCGGARLALRGTPAGAGVVVVLTALLLTTRRRRNAIRAQRSLPRATKLR